MSVIARFEVIPFQERSMSNAIASALEALDQHPVSYETTATDTIIEADTVEQLFAAVQAAHKATPNDRVITSVEIDEDRRRPQNRSERIASVERELGHPPQRQQPTQQQPMQQSRQASQQSHRQLLQQQTQVQPTHQQIQNPSEQPQQPTR